MNEIKETFELILSYYTIKVSIIYLIFYFFYLFLFSKGMNFYANRVYLLSSIFFSLILPIIQFNIIPQYIYVQEVSLNVEQNINASEPIISTSSPDYLLLFYFTGLIVTLLFLCRDFLKIYLKIKNSQSVKYENVNLIFSNEKNQYSFFNYIFINKDHDQNVLDHEMIHVRQFHSFDLILSVFFRSVIWFNPFVYSLHKFIKLNHEYICDSILIKRSGITYYAESMLNQVQILKNFSIVNNYFSYIKKRIIMMEKMNLSKKTGNLYLLMIPFFIGVICLFSFRTYLVPIETESIEKQQLSEFSSDTIRPVKKSKKSKKVSSDNKDTSQKYITLYDTISDEAGKIDVVTTNIPYNYYKSNFNKYETIADTIIVYDPETYEENLYIVETKANAIMNFLIRNELLKPQPNRKLLDKWYNENKSRKFPEPSDVINKKITIKPKWNEIKHVKSFDEIKREYEILKTIDLGDNKNVNKDETEKFLHRECAIIGCSIIVWNKKKPEKLNNKAYLIK